MGTEYGEAHRWVRTHLPEIITCFLAQQDQINSSDCLENFGPIPYTCRLPFKALSRDTSWGINLLSGLVRDMQHKSPLQFSDPIELH